MTDNIYDAVEKARNIFNIKEFPGDFFSVLNSYDYIEEFGLFLFKEDIDKLSGFIGYGPENLTAICVNYKRSYGHQNFTLAHEIGHWFLHKGKSIADADMDLSDYRSVLEREANRFAGELLYPEKCIDSDFKYALERNLFDENYRAELGRFVDELCHKYCLSYEMVLRKLLIKFGKLGDYKSFRRSIEKALGDKISRIFDADFYMPNEELPEYQKMMYPYQKINEKVEVLVELGAIGDAVGESIKLRSGVLTD